MTTLLRFVYQAVEKVLLKRWCGSHCRVNYWWNRTHKSSTFWLDSTRHANYTMN